MAEVVLLIVRGQAEALEPKLPPLSFFRRLFREEPVARRWVLLIIFCSGVLLRRDSAQLRIDWGHSKHCFERPLTVRSHKTSQWPAL